MPVFPLLTLADTHALAESLAPTLTLGMAVLLEGELGVGKTTFAQSLLRILGVHEAVLSPSFGLVHPYDTPRFPITHFDLWRVNTSDELEELGWCEACHSTLVIAEWPEVARPLWPERIVHLAFALHDGVRTVRLAHSRSGSL